MKRIIGTFAFAVALAATTLALAQPLPSAKPEEVGLSAQRLARIGEVFNQEIKDGKLPGVVIQIARKGKLAYNEAFGFRDKQAEQAMQKDSVFRIYSMTKPLATVGAMMLVEDGKIQLTDPVSKYLPEFANQQVSVARLDAFNKVTYALVPAERPTTVQDLMRHTAGLAYGEITQNTQVREAYQKAGLWKPDFDYDARALTPAEFAAGIGKAPLIHQPGSAWEYSLAVDTLGRVVEKASGKRLSEFLDERLFKPLKMTDTGFSLPQDKAARLAQPLAIDPATNTPIKLIDVSKPPGNDSGGAGGVSTAGDYLRFAQAMLNGGALDGARILSPTTVALMASDHLGPDVKRTMEPGELLMGVKGYTFGLGFMVRKEQGIAGVPGSAGEFMWAGYAGTFFWIDPKEQLVVVMMAQAPGPSRAYYRREIKQLVYASITD